MRNSACYDSRKLTVNGGWTDDVSLDYVAMLDAGFEHNLVDVAVESRVRQAGELVYASPVVVFFLGPFA